MLRNQTNTFTIAQCFGKNHRQVYNLAKEHLTGIETDIRAVRDELGVTIARVALLSPEQAALLREYLQDDKPTPALTVTRNEPKPNPQFSTKVAVTASEAAKQIGLRSARQLNELLVEKGIQFYHRTEYKYMLTAPYSERGFTVYLTDKFPNGTTPSPFTMRWTEAGLNFLHQIINNKLKIA